MTSRCWWTLPCENLSERETILQKYNRDGVCVPFDNIKSLKIAGLRSVFTGKQVVYVYHNQIDARGDKPNTEDEVFVACQEAATEIMDLIHRISTSANTYRFIVTADHGFIYKRDKVAESDKIDSIKNKAAFLNRRFVVAQEPISGDGIASMRMGAILGNSDTKWVSYPVSDDVFKVAGGRSLPTECSSFLKTTSAFPTKTATSRIAGIRMHRSAFSV